MDFSTCIPDTDPSDIILGYLLFFGTTFSFFPQFYTIIVEGTSRGISDWNNFIFAFQAGTSLISGIILDYKLFICCVKWDFWTCSNTTLDVLQIFAIFACNTAVYALVVAYYEPEEIGSLPLDQVQAEKTKEKFWVVFRFYLSNVALLALIIFAVLCVVDENIGPESFISTFYGSASGIASAIFQVIANFPQIIKTYRTKELGSFSLVTLLLQSPGSVLIAYFQYIVAKEKVGIWLSFLVGAILQIVLLIECLYYAFKKYQKDKKCRC